MPKSRLLAVLTGTALVATACSVGPVYQPPTAPVPPAYKGLAGWKVAQPSDDASRGKWWEIFQDTQLNALAAQINVSNQNLAAAEAQLRSARAAVRVAQAALWPTITGGLAISGLRQSENRGTGSSDSSGPRANLQIPLEVSYEPDVWGRIRRNVEASIAGAQASAADLETLRLSLHAELTVNYFTLRGLDAQKQLLEVTIAALGTALELTTNRYNQGVVARIDVVQAQTALESVRAQAIELGVQRAQLEHAIAILIGKPPVELSIPQSPIVGEPPVVPAGLPSELLERRPDIAAAERRVAAANAQIGIAQAALFPDVILSAAIGLESSKLVNLFSWPSLFWSVGASLTQVVLDAGRRKAVTEQVLADYDATVANYRQMVLTAFQAVEDNLAILRILEEAARQQERVIQAAETALLLAINRYKGGVTTYLEVITAQSAALNAERNAVDILTRRMTAAVLLIKALGGGWRVAST